MSFFRQTLNDMASSAEVYRERAKLSSTLLVKDVKDPELRNFLSLLYDSKNTMMRISATIMNSCFTEHKATFLFSKRILLDLLRNDKNVKRNSISGTEYKQLWSYLVSNGFFKVIRKAGKGVRAAAVLELSHQPLLIEFDKLLGEQFRITQKQMCTETFDAFISQETSQKTSLKTSLETSHGNSGNSAAAETEKNERNSSSDVYTSQRENFSPEIDQPSNEAGRNALSQKDTDVLQEFSKIVHRATSVDSALDEVVSLYRDETPGFVEEALMKLVKERFSDQSFDRGKRIVKEYASKIPYRLSVLRREAGDRSRKKEAMKELNRRESLDNCVEFLKQ